MKVNKKLKVDYSKNYFCIKFLDTEIEKFLAYQLRKEIFCDELNWVSCENQTIEVDEYDKYSYLIGALNEFNDFVGTVRIIHASQSMMIEKDFLSLLSPKYRIRKQADTAEVSRLCVRSSLDSISKTRISHALYNAIYKWCKLRDIRYLYIVVEKKMFRNLNRSGFLCHSVGPMVNMPDGTNIIAAVIDWEEFNVTKRFERDGFTHKIITAINNSDSQSVIADTNESIANCSIS